MSAPKSLVTRIHDVVDDVATRVEGLHRSVADFPLEVLGTTITPLEQALDQVRSAQARSIGAVYELIRSVNGRVRRLTAGPASR
jgi:hypothetical protein